MVKSLVLTVLTQVSFRHKIFFNLVMNTFLYIFSVCGSASCNKNNGQLTPVAQAEYLPPADDDVDEEVEDDAEEDNETEEEEVEDVVEETESSALTFAVATTLYSFTLL